MVCCMEMCWGVVLGWVEMEDFWFEVVEEYIGL